MIGQKIRNYEFIQKIGEGGFGAVYRAHEETVNRDVAIKVILPKYANDPEFKQIFEVEARLVAQLEHPHIVPLYNFWQDEQGAFLVMRYVQGGSLRHILDQQGALALNQTQRIIRHLAEALSVAHEAEIVHRDLKPANVLVDERGNAYLTDFGIAKHVNKKATLTAEDSIVGTIAYLAPEQLQGESASPQSDMYALGILLYEMLAGKHPFGDLSISVLISRHLSAPMPSLPQERPDLPVALDSIIVTATAKKPDERYPDVQAFTQDLMGIGVAPTSTPNDFSRKTRPPTSLPIDDTPTTKLPKEYVVQTPATPLGRNRAAMLQNVRSFWVEGVLENSLHHAILLELGKKTEAGKVDNPWDTLLHTNESETALATNAPILDIFEQTNGKLLILGDPGSGKTTTLLELARDLLQRARQDAQHPIPVVFNLSSWSEKQLLLTEWLEEELHNKYQVPHKTAKEWVTTDQLLLLLDGLDEVAEDARDYCVDAINAYRQEHGFVDMVVCSRTHDYEALSAQLRLNGAIVLQPLDDTAIETFLHSLGSDVAVVHELIERDAQLRELAQSPLMLSMMILAYRGASATDLPDFTSLETQRQHLFEVYVERMFRRRLGEQLFTPDDTQHYLQWLAQTMQDQAKTVFQIEELQPTVIDETQRSGFYRRVRVIHVATSAITWALQILLIGLAFNYPLELMLGGGTIGGTWIGWVYSGNEWKSRFSHVINGLIHGIVFILGLTTATSTSRALFWGTLFGVGVVMYSQLYARHFSDSGGDRDAIALIEKIQFSRKNVQRQHVILVLLVSSLWAPAMMSIWVLGRGLDTNRGIMAWFILAIGISGLLLLLSSLASSQMEVRRSPNQGVFVTFRLVSLVALASGLSTFVMFIGLTFVLQVPIWQGAVAGLGIGVGATGYAIWTVQGGIGIYRHWMLRQTLAKQGYLPYNLAQFLDYTVGLILMRKVGGGYIFIHRYLLEYFAGLSPENKS